MDTAPADAKVCYEVDLATGRVWSEPALQQTTLLAPGQELLHRPVCACELDQALGRPRPSSLAELCWQRGHSVEPSARWLGVPVATCDWLLRDPASIPHAVRCQVAERLGVPVTQIEEFRLPPLR